MELALLLHQEPWRRRANPLEVAQRLQLPTAQQRLMAQTLALQDWLGGGRQFLFPSLQPAQTSFQTARSKVRFDNFTSSLYNLPPLTS